MILNWRNAVLGHQVRLSLRPRENDPVMARGVQVKGTIRVERDPNPYPWYVNARIAGDGSGNVSIDIHDETGAQLKETPEAVRALVKAVLEETTGFMQHRMEVFERGLDGLARVFEVREEVLS